MNAPPSEFHDDWRRDLRARTRWSGRCSVRSQWRFQPVGLAARSQSPPHATPATPCVRAPTESRALIAISAALLQPLADQLSRALDPSIADSATKAASSSTSGRSGWPDGNNSSERSSSEALPSDLRPCGVSRDSQGNAGADAQIRNRGGF